MADELGTMSLEDAFSAALTEGEVTPHPANPVAQSAPGAQQSPFDEQAPGPSEQSDAGTTDPLIESMLGQSSEEDGSESTETVTNTVEVDSDAFWQTGIDLGGDDGVVTINDLTDGYMRQKDYTQKTQVLAEQRRDLEDASDFFQQWKDDPTGFAQALAVQLGLLSESDVPADLQKSMKAPTPERLAELINERAEEMVGKDPRIADYEMMQARDQVNDKFDELESSYEMSIPPELRESVLNESVKLGQKDLDGLELVFRSRLAEAQAKVGRTSAQKRTAPARPGVSGTPKIEQRPEMVDSVEEAFNLAMAELEGS